MPKITPATVIITCWGRNFVTPTIETEAEVAASLRPMACPKDRYFHELAVPLAYFARGMMHFSSATGLGVDIDEDLVRYPYKRAFPPVNRLEDGIMCHRLNSGVDDGPSSYRRSVAARVFGSGAPAGRI